MTAADRAARSDADGPVLGEDAREAVRAALVAEMGCGDPATPQGRQDLLLLGEMADGVLYALRPTVAALLVQERAAGAAEERERIARQINRADEIFLTDYRDRTQHYLDGYADGLARAEHITRGDGQHGHWIYDEQHGQVWCDAADCEPLADFEHPHWKAREAMLAQQERGRIARGES